MQVWRKNALVAALALTVLPALAQASVVYSDSFESDTAGSAPAGWTRQTSTSGFTLNTVADSTAGSGSAQAMDMNETTTSTRYGQATFSGVTLSPGDTVQMSFDLWFTGTVPSGDRLFRYGIYNSGITNGPGITGRIGTGTDAAPTAFMDVYDSPKVFDVTTADGAKQAGADKTDSGAVMNDNNLRHITLTATLVSGSPSPSMALTNAIYDANGNLLGSATGTDTTVNDTTFTFNEIAIGFNSTLPAGGVDYRIDNVNVTDTPAPEPVCLGMLAMIPVTLRRRRR